MGNRRRAFLIALTICAPVAAGAAQSCEEDEIWLRGPFGQARFDIELADDPLERGQGLMFVEQMDRFEGMLFVYETEGPVHFWMKNTLIPLDMVFADADGVVQKVHPNAVPQDLTAIHGGDSIQYVLEINGGLAATLGIKPGAEMRHPSIANSAWPCEGS